MRQKCGVAVDETRKRGKNGRNKAGLVEALFQSNEDEKEEEFVGFTREEVDKVVEMQSIVWLFFAVLSYIIANCIFQLQTCQTVCSCVPSAGKELWLALFGDEVENRDNDFQGFSQEEM